MREYSSWSLSLGRVVGVRLRLHALFLAVGVLILFASSRAPDMPFVGVGFLAVAVLFASVLLHELGHCFAAFRFGGTVDQIVIGPLGGMAPVNVPHEPRRELLVALVGPMVNFAIWLAMAPILVVMGQNLIELLKPFESPLSPTDSFALAAVKLIFWQNWLLVLVNIILPAFPLDCGRVMRSVLWPAFGYRSAVIVVARFSQATVIALIFIAWLVDERADNSVAWVPLTLFAIFIFFSAKAETDRLDHHEEDDDLLGYDFSQGYTSLERTLDANRNPPRPGGLQRWLQKRRETKLRRLEEIERLEELRVDEILARLHENGMDGVTAEEQALLQRVSARYRNRQRN